MRLRDHGRESERGELVDLRQRIGPNAQARRPATGAGSLADPSVDPPEPFWPAISRAEERTIQLGPAARMAMRSLKRRKALAVTLTVVTVIATLPLAIVAAALWVMAWTIQQGPPVPLEVVVPLLAFAGAALMVVVLLIWLVLYLVFTLQDAKRARGLTR